MISAALDGRGRDRVAERESLRAVLTETEADSQVEDAAAFEHDGANAVCKRLAEMLPPPRHDILIETAAVVSDRVYDAIAELRGAYGIMCALGEVTGTLPRSVHAQLPSLPYGPVEFDVDADDASAATTAWRAPLDALARDPDAVVTVPGAEKPQRQRRLMQRLQGDH